MLRLVLGKLYDGAAILPGKIDERLRRIASLVNGGLTDANLDPAFTFAAARFAENRSVFVLQARWLNAEAVGLDRRAIFPAVPVACHLEYLEAVQVGSPAGGALPIYKGKVGVSNTSISGVGQWSHTNESTYPGAGAAGATRYRHTFARAVAQADLAAGEQIWLNPAAAVNRAGHIMARFSVPHSA